jgi:IS30 family transposase
VFVSKYAPRGAPNRDELARLAANGVTLRQMAAALDRSVATIRYWLERWEIPRADLRRRGYDPQTAPRESLRRCAQHGLTMFVLEGRGSYRCKRWWQAALQFHHRDPGEKLFALSHQGITRSLAKAREEARKCILLCANCHAEIEGGYRDLEGSLAS